MKNVYKPVMVLVVALCFFNAAQAALSCKQDSNCRRNVCINGYCKPRSLTDGPCNTNNHCFGGSICTPNNVCAPAKELSPPGGSCVTGADCQVLRSACVDKDGFRCESPLDGECDINEHCDESVNSCIGGSCKAKSGLQGPCDNADNSDCVSPNVCNGQVCSSPVVIPTGCPGGCPPNFACMGTRCVPVNPPVCIPGCQPPLVCMNGGCVQLV